MENATGLDLASDSATVASREDEGCVVELVDAVGVALVYGEERKPVTVRVAGTYSARYRRTLNSQRDRMLKQRRTKLTGEAVERNQVELVAACILGWDGIFDKGAPLPLTSENAVRVLTLMPWVFSQLEEAMGDHEGFFRSSSKS